MCDCTLGSDPAHPKFWRNFLPNKEQIEKNKNSSLFQKKVYKRKDSLHS